MGVDEIDKNNFAEFDIPSDAISGIQSLRQEFRRYYTSKIWMKMYQ